MQFPTRSRTVCVCEIRTLLWRQMKTAYGKTYTEITRAPLGGTLYAQRLSQSSYGQCGYHGKASSTQVIARALSTSTFQCISSMQEWTNLLAKTEFSIQDFSTFSLQCGNHGNVSSYPRHIIFTIICTSMPFILRNRNKFCWKTKEFSTQDFFQCFP